MKRKRHCDILRHHINNLSQLDKQNTKQMQALYSYHAHTLYMRVFFSFFFQGYIFQHIGVPHAVLLHHNLPSFTTNVNKMKT